MAFSLSLRAFVFLKELVRECGCSLREEIRACVFISSALRRLKIIGRVSIFLFFGAMGMAFIQKGGGIFCQAHH
jgi:hypothetical protein